MARSRLLLSACALLLALALACASAPALAQDTTTSLKCKPVAFVLAGRWIPFTSRSGDNSYVIMTQQPVVTTHSLVLVFGMDQRAAAANDTSTTMSTLEFKVGSDAAITFGKPRTGRYMSKSNPADATMLSALPDYFAPLRFDVAVPWKVDSRRFTFVFRHASCPEQRIVYKYNPRGALQPIIPGDVPVGEQDPTAPTTPVDPIRPTPAPTTGTNVQHCQLTAVAASQWACTPAFARDVYDYQCTAPSGAFLERVTVQGANSFLAMKLTAESDAVDTPVTRGLVSGVDSSTFPLAVGHNMVEISTQWGGVCNASYVFQVQREQAPVVAEPTTPGETTPGETTPDETTPVVTPVAPANWRVEDWGVCTGSCSDAAQTGSQTREVVCVTEANESVDESRCTGAKPATSQACQLTCDSAVVPEEEGSNGTGGKDFSNLPSSAPSSAFASPLAMLAAAAFAFLALNQ